MKITKFLIFTIFLLESAPAYAFIDATVVSNMGAVLLSFLIAVGLIIFKSSSLRKKGLCAALLILKFFILFFLWSTPVETTLNGKILFSVLDVGICIGFDLLIWNTLRKK